MGMQRSVCRTSSDKLTEANLNSYDVLILMKELEERMKILQQFSQCFRDHRDLDWVDRNVIDLFIKSEPKSPKF